MKKIENSECLYDFGNYIRKAREEKGMMQREVAELVGISQNYYSEIENGLISRLNIVLALQICQSLKLDLNGFVAKYLK